MQLPDREPPKPAPVPSYEPKTPSREAIKQVPDFLERTGERAKVEPEPIAETETGFESAVPNVRDPFEDEKGWHGVSQRQIIITASVAAVAMIVFIVLFVTRPWSNPNQSNEAPDLTRAGEIETMSRLRGQDSDRNTTNSPQSTVSVSEASEIQSIYQELGELGTSMAARTESFEKDIKKSESERAQIYSEVMSYENKLDDIKTRLSAIDPTGNTALSNDVLNFKELTEILDKELYGLTEAWTLADGYPYPDQVDYIVMQPLEDQKDYETDKNQYAVEFEKKYASYAPASPSMVAS